MHLVNEVAREQILARVIRQVADRYDVVLIDCQPSLGLLTVNALTAAHGVLIPLETEYFALRGVALLVETIDKVRDRLNPAIKLDGILATMYDSRTLHSREVLERVVEAFGDQVLETVIARTVKFPDASVAAAPITDLRLRSPRRRPVPPTRERADRSWRRRLRRRLERERWRDALGRPRHAGFSLTLEQLQRTVRPAALAHHQARARHHRGLAERGDRRVHLLPARARGRRPSSIEASEFLVVAATLLDLKVAGLLPQGELVDAEDVALLEARDLLFARLLQYRAFKEAATWFSGAARGRVDTARARRCGSRRSSASRRRSWSGRSASTTSRPSPRSR